MDQEKRENDGKISFGFTKKKEAKVLEKRAHEPPPITKKEETDFVRALEGKEVKSIKPKATEKPLVIPLIKRNDYGRHGNRQPAAKNGRTNTTEESSPMETSADSLVDDAVKEIIKDAAQYNEEWEGRGTELDLNLTIPLLMQNKVPDGTETDDRLDVSIRPDGANEADYSQVPIEQFGMAMLRGMGWNEQEGIGDKMKKVVKPIEAVLRPKGQGLGADRRPGDEMDRKKLRKLKPGEERVEEEPQGFAKGIGVLVTSGAHKNLYGKIEGVDDDIVRLVIKLALSGQTVTLSQYNVKIVDKDEYKKYSKDISRFSKGHEEKSQDNKNISSEESHHDKTHHDKTHHDKTHHDKTHHDKTHHDKTHDKRTKSNLKHSDKHRTSDGDKYSEKDSHRHSDTRQESKTKHGRESDIHGDKPSHTKGGEDDASTKRRRLEDVYGRESPTEHTHNGHAESGHQAYWLRPDLRVRFIDRLYKKGKYYNSKVVIVDVVTRSTCTCQTEDGRLLEDIDQSMLETLIPKTEMACVMIVAGKLSGQLGLLVNRDKSKAKADVQLLQERDQIERLSYDDICEYAGNIHEEVDY